MKLNILHIDTRRDDAGAAVAELRRRLSPEGNVVSEAGRRRTLRLGTPWVEPYRLSVIGDCFVEPTLGQSRSAPVKQSLGVLAGCYGRRKESGCANGECDKVNHADENHRDARRETTPRSRQSGCPCPSRRKC